MSLFEHIHYVKMHVIEANYGSHFVHRSAKRLISKYRHEALASVLHMQGATDDI